MDGASEHAGRPVPVATADVLVAILVGSTTVTWTLLAADRAVPAEGLGWIGWACLLSASAVLIARRHFPTSVTLATLAISAIYYPTGNPDGPIALTCIVGIYTIAARGMLLRSAVLGGFAVVGVVLREVTNSMRNLDDLAIFLLSGWVVAAVALGGMKWAYEVYRTEAEQRAAAVEHSRAEEIRRLAAEEQVRIARELHDAVGHHISLVSVQATAALHAATHRGTRPDSGAETALRAIKEASGQAMRELRAVLRVLRQVDEAVPREPQPGIDRLPQLVGDAQALGLQVETSVTGAPRALPREVDLAAYRILQESLTNVTRHAQASHVRISIGYGDDDLSVEVLDDGRGGNATPGNGLLGMAERANLLGGELVAEPHHDGGFRVRARLPVGGV